MIDILIQSQNSVGKADGKLDQDGDELGCGDELGNDEREASTSMNERDMVTPRAILNAPNAIIIS